MSASFLRGFEEAFLALWCPVRTLPCKRFREMLAVAVEQAKIARVVIVFHAVDVMHDFMSLKQSAEFLFHHEAMFSDVP